MPKKRWKLLNSKSAKGDLAFYFHVWLQGERKPKHVADQRADLPEYISPHLSDFSEKPTS